MHKIVPSENHIGNPLEIEASCKSRSQLLTKKNYCGGFTRYYFSFMLWQKKPSLLTKIPLLERKSIINLVKQSVIPHYSQTSAKVAFFASF